MSDDSRIEDILARLVSEKAEGREPSIASVLAANPDLAGPLQARWTVLQLLDRLAEGGPPAAPGLEALSQTGRPLRPVTLADPSGDDAVPLAVPTRLSDRWGRYAVLGEIARGGVGVVLKARDPDLGRDVALKVLRHEHAANRDALQRFVEEAQIGGQLQHPGIVPVYDFGLGSEGQPYFAMKLVKGRTLAQLLAGREPLASTRPALLSVFQAVCQTIAYAHDRGIVHRDLKPSNVMVGAFGEVQVVDWGMSKILARGGAADDAGAVEVTHPVVRTVRSSTGSAPSVVGSVLGTPQYMPPEQARGELDRIDERADVFALGAILCEILTGRPPYVGTEAEILAQAAHGALEPAVARVRSCGGDAQLVSLCVSCLAGSPTDRPRTAGVVAAQVSAYLAALEDRARRAEADAAEARIRTIAERRARRLTLALSAAVLALVLVGGGGWIWTASQRRSRADGVERQVERALADATRLRGQAEAAGAAEALPLWREALATARRAEAVAASVDADQATRERVVAATSEMTEAQHRAEAAAEQRRRDDAAAERLDVIRVRFGETWDMRAKVADYAKAFQEYLGGDVDALGTEEAASRIHTSRIRERLILGLMDWMAARQTVDSGPTILPELIARVDTDPWRAKARKAAGSPAALRDLAAQSDLDARNVLELLWLAEVLAGGGDIDRAMAMHLETWRRHPGDFWACFEFATRSQYASPPRLQEATRYYTAALAIRPRSVAVHQNMGNLCLEDGRIEDAIREFRSAIRIDPKFAFAHVGLSNALVDNGDLGGAISALREAIRLDPALAAAHNNLAQLLSLTGDLPASLAEALEAVRLAPSWAVAHGSLGAARLESGDLDGAISAFREALRLDPTIAQAHNGLGVTLQHKGDLEGAAFEFREAIRLDPRLPRPHVNLGTTLHQKGDRQAAVAAYREAIRLDPRDAEAHAGLGQVFQNSGDLDGAIAEFREAMRLDPTVALTYWNLAQALKGRGRLRESLEALERLTTLSSQGDLLATRARQAQEVETVRRLIAAADRLPAFARGEAKPTTAQDAFDMAVAGYCTQAYAAASRAWQQAFALMPSSLANIQESHRYNAACSAALAGAGRGTDVATLDDEDLARWRRQALEWLRADLDAWRKVADTKVVRATLDHWKVDPDLAGIRDEAELAQLPAEEREALMALWRDVDQTIGVR
jgi:tetratricopeptide (TPR) repeat protein/tRNA A-37 threonylcarbamoyl transferase component Bud32